MTAEDQSEKKSPQGGQGGANSAVPAAKEMQKILAEKRMAQQQAQVDEVVGIMRTNVEKVLERDSKLHHLDERADALQSGASQFEKQAGKLKQKFWLENTRWVILFLVTLLIVGLVIYFNYYDTNSDIKIAGDRNMSSPEVVLDTEDTEAKQQEMKMPTA